MGKQTFILSEQHIKLLRAARVVWNAGEFGAPAINPGRPYGNGDVYADMMRILYAQDDTPSNDLAYMVLDRLHAETATALQVVLAAGSFAPGLYEADQYRTNWRQVAEQGD